MAGADDGFFDDVFAHHPDAPGGKGDSFFDDVFAHEVPGPAGRPGEPAPHYPWNAAKSAVNTLDLGYGPEIHGNIAATRELIHSLLTGSSLSHAAGAFATNRDMETGFAQRGHAAYARENPGTDLAASLAGTVAPTIAAGGAGDAALLGSAMRGLAAAAPEARAAIAGSPLASWLAKRGLQAVHGALTGAESAALEAHNSDRPLGEQISTGAKTGAALTPAISQALEPILSNISPLVARSASALRGLGVDVKAGMIPGSATMLRLMNKLYGDGGAEARSQLTQAALKTTGSNASALTDSAVTQRNGELSNQFQQFAGLASKANLNDKILQHDIGSIFHDATTQRISDSGIDDLKDVAGLIHKNGAPINGADYLQLTRGGGPLDRAMRHPEIGEHAIQLRDALDDALERGVQSGFGKWVPGAPASPTSPASIAATLQGPAAARQLGVGLPEGLDSQMKPNFTMSPKGDVVPYSPNPGDYTPNFTRPGMEPPVSGTLENGPGPPPEPGMTWEYDPGAEGLVNHLRQTRAQWRNLKILEPLTDNTTGEISPAALNAKVTKAFSKSSRSQPTSQALDLKALGEGSNFIPEAKNAEAPGMMQRMLEKGWPALAVAGLELGNEIPTLEANWKPILMTGAGALAARAAGRGINALANEGPIASMLNKIPGVNATSNTDRIIANALSGRGATAIPYADLLAGPASLGYNQPDQQQATQ